MIKALWHSLSADPRHGQILALSGLLALGHWYFAFEMPLWRPGVAVLVALATQWIAGRLIGFGFDWRSPLITAGSLTLLLRTDGPALVALAACLAIASKAALRIDGRHFINPAAFAIGIVTLGFEGAWIAPGQWGSAGVAMVFAVGVGLAVTHGARRLEVPFLFLTAWAVLVFGRALWLGDPMTVPMHQMGSGALFVFAFFMISDPMTAPWHAGARALWIALVAIAGFWLQTRWIVDVGPIFGLLALCWMVPILNRIFPARRLLWRAARNTVSTEGVRP